MLHVEISRAKWHRGQGSLDSRLLISTNGLGNKGKMCCLGFASLAAKLTPDQIANIPYPYYLGEALPKSLSKLVQPTDDGDGRYNSPICGRIAATNDNVNLTDDQREAELTKLAAEADLAFTFVD